jgi:serine phosphatase RsbU (regulator of sigma subunit)
MRKEDQIEFLRTIDLFSSVPDDVLMQIGKRLEEVQIEPDTTLLRENEIADALYFIVDGTLRIESGGFQLVKRHRGECVGEFSLLDDSPRSADAIADTQVLLLKLGRDDFKNVIFQSPEVASGMFKVLLGKIRQEDATKEHWRQDLRRASEIQLGMLPEDDMCTNDVELSAYCHPATDVGGDYYDYLTLSEDRVGIFLGDVTGHGFYSGLFVAMAKSCLHAHGAIGHAPKRVIEAMNRTVSLSLQSGILMTCCYCLIDPRRRVLTYSNAGHNFPYHYRRSSDKLEQLESTDILLGVPGFEETEFHEQERTWEKGDLLLLYSDGITEAQNMDGDMFEKERLEEALMKHRDASPKRIKEEIAKSLSDYCRNLDQNDDIALIVAKAL